MVRTARKLRKLAKILFFFFLCFLLILSTFGFYIYYQRRILSFSSTPSSFRNKSLSEAPTRISIPSAGINLPIETGSIINGVWEISLENATFLDISAKPGNGGNTVIYGHNKKAIFGNLNKVGVGYLIILETHSGDVFNYKVESIQTVKPTQVDVIAPTDFEILTVYTCNGILDSTRLVIKAKPV